MARRELARAGIGPAEAEARFILEHVSGYDTGDWLEIADAAPPARAVRKLRDLVRRRVAGEP
ncbi:MAG: PrmC N-terminal domain, partial [Actinomycetota bacterium]|nr:PrmC N-terminal domain [Actinomycetota bacterium]